MAHKKTFVTGDLAPGTPLETKPEAPKGPDKKVTHEGVEKPAKPCHKPEDAAS
jgi:hypothetical protein